jgi:integral membrane protein (TIGR00529 family)
VIQLLKTGIVFAVMIVLIRLKLRIGYVLLAGALILGFLFGVRPAKIALTALSAAVEPRTLNLVAVVLLITILGALLRHIENLKRLIVAMEGLLRDARLVAAAAAAFVGLLPMPGGAMLSAPMVEEASARYPLTGAQKTAINHWFRHIWEYIFPLYPGIILTVAILGISINELVLANFPLTLAAILAGLLFYLRPIAASHPSPEAATAPTTASGSAVRLTTHLKSLLIAVWPVVLVIVATLAFGVPLILSLVGTLAVLVAIKRIPWRDLWKIVVASVTLELVILIVGVMVFKAMIEESGAVMVIPEFLVSLGISPLVVLFTVPFIVGILAGLTVAYVGIAFPILMHLIAPNGVNLTHTMLAYAGGFMGVMASPVHLCLILTKDYFGANLGRVYRLLIPAVLFVTVIVVLLVLSGWPP